MLQPHERALLAGNRVLRDCHRGARAFILATGPSIRSQDLRPLRGEICISVSNFVVHPDYAYIRPRYHCIAPYHRPIAEQAWQAWMDDLEARLQAAAIFYSVADRQRNEHGGRFASRQRYYLAFRRWDQARQSLQCRPPVAGPASGQDRGGEYGAADWIELTQPIVAPHGVTVLALQVALYMGFDRIYLLGCDHDWILHLNRSEHFYEEDQHALHRAGYCEWFGPDFAAYCQSYVNLWDQYKSLGRIARRRSVQIFNATPGGLLDVFERADLNQVIAAGRRSTEASSEPPTPVGGPTPGHRQPCLRPRP